MDYDCRAMFDSQTQPAALHKEDWINQDIHCVPSLIKLFFREIPKPFFENKSCSLLKRGASVSQINSDSREALPYFVEALKSLNGPQHK